MRITNIELVEVVVPALPDAVNSPGLDQPLHRLAHGASEGWTLQFDELPKWIIVATCDDGTVGIGESLRGCRPDVLAAIAQTLIGIDLVRLPLAALPFPRTREFDGFEALVYDLVGKALGVPASTLMGGAVRDRVAVSAWSGHRTPEDAAARALAAADAGLRMIKFKCSLDDDVVAWAAAIRSVCGDRIEVVLDPNERFEEMRHAVRIARALEEIGNVAALEDPLPRWDLDAYAELRRRTTVPIAVHVALGYSELGQAPHDVLRAWRAGAADVFNFSGGMSDFRRLATCADVVGMPYWHGSEIDCGVLEAAAVHAAAASPGCTLPSDLFGTRVREHDLLSRPLHFHDDVVDVPDAPGLGVDLDFEAVSKYEQSRVMIR